MNARLKFSLFEILGDLREKMMAVKIVSMCESKRRGQYGALPGCPESFTSADWEYLLVMTLLTPSEGYPGWNAGLGVL